MMMKACARNLFAKAAKRHVRVPEDLAVQVERLALRRCLDLLGLARRAGAVVAGFEKVRAALRAGEVGLLVQAADGADDGRQKIQALARARSEEHTSELQSLMRISYAVFCLQKKKKHNTNIVQ